MKPTSFFKINQKTKKEKGVHLTLLKSKMKGLSPFLALSNRYTITKVFMTILVNKKIKQIINRELKIKDKVP